VIPLLLLYDYFALYMYIYIFLSEVQRICLRNGTLYLSALVILYSGRIAFSHQIERKWDRSGILAITRPKSVRKSWNRTDRKIWDICVIVARGNWWSWSIVRSTQDPSMWIPVISIHVLNSSFYTVLYYVFWVFWEDGNISMLQCAMCNAIAWYDTA